MRVAGKNAPSCLHILWDESHLWGLLLEHALNSLSLPAIWVRSREIAGGILSSSPPQALLVPGGWAKLKSQSLGRKGRQEIREYVRSGGFYMGMCGGAGLALQRQTPVPGLGLCPWKRRTFKGSLPNFSGHILSEIHNDDDFFDPPPRTDASLPVWWPSQFTPAGDSDSVRVLATYRSPGPDFWVADLDVRSLDKKQLTQWERLYKINLRPDMLKGEPCIIGGNYGKGHYVLSYSHLETPDSPQANQLLAHFLSSSCSRFFPDRAVPPLTLSKQDIAWNDPELLQASDMLESIFRTGERHFLLFWRTPWLLGWRRGIPGSQLNTLIAFVRLLCRRKPGPRARALWDREKDNFMHLLERFRQGMETYLLEERLTLSTAPSTPESSSSDDLQVFRESLVGNFPGYGGLFGDLVQILDDLFWELIKPE